MNLTMSLLKKLAAISDEIKQLRSDADTPTWQHVLKRGIMGAGLSGAIGGGAAAAMHADVPRSAGLSALLGGTMGVVGGLYAKGDAKKRLADLLRYRAQIRKTAMDWDLEKKQLEVDTQRPMWDHALRGTLRGALAGAGAGAGIGAAYNSVNSPANNKLGVGSSVSVPGFAGVGMIGGGAVGLLHGILTGWSARAFGKDQPKVRRLVNARSQGEYDRALRA